MAIRLVNKSKADCDINLFSGRTVRLRPSSYITLNEKITQESIGYYRQLRDLGLYLEEVVDAVPEVPAKEPEQVKEPEKVETPVEQVEASVEQVVETTAEEKVEEITEAEETSEEVVEETESVEAPVLNAEDLMKYTKPELLEMASAYGITDLDGASKKQIVAKILDVVGK